MNCTCIGGAHGVSERIRVVRMGTGLNQKEFGSLVGVSKSTQLRYENGQSVPDICYLERVASEYEIDRLWLMAGHQIPREARATQAGELTDEVRIAIAEAQKWQIKKAEFLPPEKFVTLVSELIDPTDV